MAIEAWPSISETTLGLTFLERSSVAHVSKIVEANLWQLRPLQQRLEAVRGDVAAVQRLPDLGGEYEPVLLPEGGHPIYLC